MIVQTPGTCGGKPRIDGTRITVKLIMQYVNTGHPTKRIAELYPHITEQDIEDCIKYTKEKATKRIKEKHGH